ncbi:MAG: hypothetical protein HY722_05350 [Planctomycetes bacterium]|nr:hypothetical protein [Planctomycetota bacterium]
MSSAGQAASDHDPERVQAFLQEALSEAADLARRMFHTVVEVGRDARGRPCSRADRSVESLLAHRVKTAWPADRVVLQHFPPVAGTGEWTWVVDAMAGMWNFVHGLPLHGTSLALLRSGVPLHAGVTLPALSSTYVAIQGWGLKHPGERKSIAHGPGRPLGEGSVVLVSGRTPEPDSPLGHALAALATRGVEVRRLGSTALDLVLLATGDRVAAAIAPEADLLDLAAGAALLAEVRGALSDLQGRPPWPVDLDEATCTRRRTWGVLASVDPGLHQEMLRLLSSGREA